MFEAALGWLGTAGTLSAYLMLSRGRLRADSVAYLVLNLVGGLLGGVASAALGAWPSVTANLVWAAISARTLLDSLSARDLLERAVAWLPYRAEALVGRATSRY